MKPDEYLSSAAEMYRYKSTMYGNNYLQFGGIMKSMFPNGLTVKTEDEWNRLHLFIMNMIKTTRYAQNFNNGGHEDSVIDGIVYLAMLHQVDDLAKQAEEAQIFGGDGE